MKRQTSVLRANDACWCRGRAPIKNHKCLCSVNELVQIVGRKYSLSLISLIAARGRIRFGDIRSEMDDMSKSTLSNRLAEFVQAGLIHRRTFRMTPPRVEYALTNEGERLRLGLLSLASPDTDRRLKSGEQ
jgi:DNA-binding HxlR family transcriptional regulator